MTDAIEQEQMSNTLKWINDYVHSDDEHRAYEDWRWAWYGDDEEANTFRIEDYRNQAQWVEDLRDYLIKKLGV